jgi:hypothetical protein
VISFCGTRCTITRCKEWHITLLAGAQGESPVCCVPIPDSNQKQKASPPPIFSPSIPCRYDYRLATNNCIYPLLHRPFSLSLSLEAVIWQVIFPPVTLYLPSPPAHTHTSWGPPRVGLLLRQWAINFPDWLVPTTYGKLFHNFALCILIQLFWP